MFPTEELTKKSSFVLRLLMTHAFLKKIKHMNSDNVRPAWSSEMNYVCGDESSEEQMCRCGEIYVLCVCV